MQDKTRLARELKALSVLLFAAFLFLIWILSGAFFEHIAFMMRITFGMFPGMLTASITYLGGILILKYLSILTATATGACALFLVLLFQGIFYRPFIAESVSLFPVLFMFLTGSVMTVSWKLKGDFLKRAVRTVVIFYWIIPPCIFLSVAKVYKGTHLCSLVKNNPRIVLLLDFCTKGWRQEMARRTGLSADSVSLEEQARSIFPSSDRNIIFAGTGVEDAKEERLLIALDRKTRKILKVIKMPTPFRGVCSAGKCVITATPTNQVYLLNEKSLTVTQKFTLPFRARFLAADFPSNKVFLPGSLAQGLEVVHLNTGTLHRYSFHHPRHSTYIYTPAADAVYNDYNKYTGNLYIAAERYLDFPCLHIFQFTRNRSHPVFLRSCFSFRDAVLSLGLSTAVEVDPLKEEIYMAFPLEGSIYVLSERNFQLVKKLKVSVGIREMAFDTRRSLLYAANYTTGYIYGVFPLTGEIRKKIFIGKRIREIHYDPVLDRLLATSANGFMEVMLD